MIFVNLRRRAVFDPPLEGDRLATARSLGEGMLGGGSASA
jgi:hypothetical protein